MTVNPETPSFEYFLPLAAALVLTVGACTSERASPVSVEQIAAEEGPDQESWNVVYYLGEAGAPRAKMRASHMARYETSDSVYVVLDGASESDPESDPARDPESDLGDLVEVEVFGSDGEQSRVTAREIRIDEESQTYVLTGDVEVVTSSGRKLQTERLTWFEQDAQIRAPGFVRITSETENLQGYGLDADEMLERYTLSKVTGRVYLEDE